MFAFYGKITTPLGITFAVQMSGFVYLHIGKKYARYTPRIFQRIKGACHMREVECAYFLLA
jgi:hypothetical protein